MATTNVWFVVQNGYVCNAWTHVTTGERRVRQRMNNEIQTYLEAVQESIAFVNTEQIEQALDVLFQAFVQERAVFTMGNGASASLAAHMACDLGKGTATDIGLGPGLAPAHRLRITSLVDNIALMTAYGNDVSYEDVFVEQLKGLLAPGDVVIAI